MQVERHQLIKWQAAVEIPDGDPTWATVTTVDSPHELINLTLQRDVFRYLSAGGHGKRNQAYFALPFGEIIEKSVKGQQAFKDALCEVKSIHRENDSASVSLAPQLLQLLPHCRALKSRFEAFYINA